MWPLTPSQTAPKAPAKPTSLLAEHAATVTVEVVETVRLGLEAQARGEQPGDTGSYVAGCKELKITAPVEEMHIAAIKSFPDLAGFEDEYNRRIEQANADEIRWRKEEQRLDVALTAARNARRAAQHAQRLLADEMRQNNQIIAWNPFLLGPIEDAAKFARFPSLTTNEVGTIGNHRHPEVAAQVLREQKLKEINSAK